MLPDSISVNPHLLPDETPSFFKTFVGGQDDLYFVGKGGKPPQAETSHTPILQVKMSDGSMTRPSIFVPHQLKPAHKEQVILVGSDPAWILGLFLLGLLLAVIVKTSFPRRLTQIFNAFISPRNLNVLIKEGNLLTERITPPLLLLQLISYALFFYQLVVSTSRPPDFLATDYLLYLFILGITTLVYFFRVFLIRVIGWIFGTNEQSRVYLVNTMVFNEVWGLVLLPICVMIFYSRADVSWVLLMIATGLFVAMMIYMFVRNFMIGLTVTKFSWVYLFLYLCTVEILPLAILGKIATDNMLLTSY